ncbi:dTDP-4-dehydrorhamnose reductase [soil metagenome]
MADAVNVLVTGGKGQVGTEVLRANWPSPVLLHAPTRDQLDLTDPASVAAAFAETSYAAVINCAAYTAVDDAEDDIRAAFSANAMGPAYLAQATREAKIPLIHVSTDYVFDGSLDGPYQETDSVGPIGVYGASKLAGELAVRSGNDRSVVVRTAWVLSAHRANFLKTMLRLAAERPEIDVVDDQLGCPTSAEDIAALLRVVTLRMMSDRSAPRGVYHFVNGGEASWAALATEIMTLSRERGGPIARIAPIATSQYPTRAHRPANSRLATSKLQRDFGMTPRPWREAVAGIMDELYPRGVK